MARRQDGKTARRQDGKTARRNRYAAFFLLCTPVARADLPLTWNAPEESLFLRVFGFILLIHAY